MTMMHAFSARVRGQGPIRVRERRFQRGARERFRDVRVGDAKRIPRRSAMTSRAHRIPSQRCWSFLRMDKGTRMLGFTRGTQSTRSQASGLVDSVGAEQRGRFALCEASTRVHGGPRGRDAQRAERVQMYPCTRVPVCSCPAWRASSSHGDESVRGRSEGRRDDAREGASGFLLFLTFLFSEKRGREEPPRDHASLVSREFPREAGGRSRD